MTVTYEWDIETYDVEDEDVLDHHHESALIDFADCDLREALQDRGSRLVLVRDETFIIQRGPNAGMESTRRDWAYVENGKMPGNFGDIGEDGFKVPKRFLTEFARRVASLTA